MLSPYCAGWYRASSRMYSPRPLLRLLSASWPRETTCRIEKEPQGRPETSFSAVMSLGEGTW